MMTLESSYPVLMVEDVKATADFYIRHFGFEETFSSDWYVSLRHAERPASELAFLQVGHETVPEGYSTRSRGLLVNLEVTDAEAEYARLVESGLLQPLVTLRDEVFGQRHFIVIDPADNMVDVIQVIPFSEEFARLYA